MTTTRAAYQHPEDRPKGIGRQERRRLVHQWKAEGQGRSLKQWAREALIGEARMAWIMAKGGK